MNSQPTVQPMNIHDIHDTGVIVAQETDQIIY